MTDLDDIPKTLVDAIRYFSAPDTCIVFVAQMKWPRGPECPKCQSKNIAFLGTRRIFKCRECKKQFSVKVGTIFEDSPIPLNKWLAALWMIANCKNGISSYEVHRAIGVTQKTAWFMLHPIRRSMPTGTFKKLSGTVQIDESFIGGKARNMHFDKRKEKIHGRGSVGKAIMLGALERSGEVKATVVKDRKRETLHEYIKGNVVPGAEVHTDDLESYDGLDDYIHKVVNHAETYVAGDVHTNGLENFWILLKRSIKGTYVSVEPFHLFRYLAEQVFRYNERKGTDASRFVELCG